MSEQFPNSRESSGLGYIILPEGVNREIFVSTCFNKEQFTICTNTGEIIPNVPVSNQVLNYIEIPNTPNTLGTQVAFINDENHNKPFIISSFSKQKKSEFRGEYDLKIEKGSVGLNGNSFLSKLVIFVRNSKSKISNLLLDVTGNKDSVLGLNSSGWIVLKFESGLKLKNDKREIIIDDDKFMYADGKHNLKIDLNGLTYKDGINSFKINKEGYVLGNLNFKDYMLELLNFLNNEAMFMTASGPTLPGISKSTSVILFEEIISKMKNIND